MSYLSQQLEDGLVKLGIVRHQRVQTVTVDLTKKKRERKGASVRL